MEEKSITNGILEFMQIPTLKNMLLHKDWVIEEIKIKLVEVEMQHPCTYRAVLGRKLTATSYLALSVRKKQIFKKLVQNQMK